MSVLHLHAWCWGPEEEFGVKIVSHLVDAGDQTQSLWKRLHLLQLTTEGLLFSPSLAPEHLIF